MFAKVVVVRIFHFVKVVFVQLPDEGREIGVLEHPRQDGLGEFVHILDDETIPQRSPAYDILEGRIFEHFVEFFHEVAG